MSEPVDELRAKGDLFKRVPTNEEKVFYRAQWGAIPPLTVAFGLCGSMLIGLLVGLCL